MLSKRDRDLVERSKRILAKARQHSAAEQLEGLVKKGIVNKQGRKNVTAAAKKSSVK